MLSPSLKSIFTPEAVSALVAHGLIPGEKAPAEAKPAAEPKSVPTLQSLTPLQKEIHKALTYRQLNQNQVALLWIYLEASYSKKGALSIEIAAASLAKKTGYSWAEAEKNVEGCLRAFGKRLNKTLKKIPLKIGKDKHGDGVADELPLLALVKIEKGANGTRHQLTADGEVVTELLLSTSDLGLPDATPIEPMVNAEIKASTAELLLKAQTELGLSFDETLLHLAGLAGIKVQ